MTVVMFLPKAHPIAKRGLQRNVLDEVGHRLALAQKACWTVCELLQAMTELAELIRDLEDHRTPALATSIDLARRNVDTKLVALSLLHKELQAERATWDSREMG
jgi:hypothetical protein